MRRRLGPVAWCVLECLIERSNDRRTAVASVRSLARDLGVAKNTAHRALAALVRTGVAEPVQDRDAAGRFRPGRYWLHVDELLAGDTADASATPTRSRPSSRSRSRSARRADHSQLSLLTAD
jgi:DNA-binding IclR family transcriptional regulator